MKPKLLLATANPGKLREMRAIFAALGRAGRLELLSLADVGIDHDVPETGSTYRENAALKAETYARLSGLPVLSDDSGLEVDALGGAPGLHSKRYLAVPGATDADRRAYLLSNLAGRPRPWTAAFRCVTAAMQPGGAPIFGIGVCPGVIVPQERGTGGFGYDPIFELPGGRTMAELVEAEKNRLSHRGLAVADIHDRLMVLLGG